MLDMDAYRQMTDVERVQALAAALRAAYTRACADRDALRAAARAALRWLPDVPEARALRALVDEGAQ